MTAVLTRRGTEVEAIDLFCGFGGSSQGIHKAGATVRVAANHNPLAIENHAANYPDVDHRRADLSNPDAADYIDPQDLPYARFLWASPSCKHHSPANAQKIYSEGPGASLDTDVEEAFANSERSRVTMLCPLRYAAKHRPEIVVVENVVECAKWGPGRDGSTFRWWLHEWELLGYEYECLFLNSQFFPPCPQSRDRMYVVIWRKGNTRPDLDYRPVAICTSDRCSGAQIRAVQTWKRRTASWPIERWGKYKAQYTYNCPDCDEVVEPVAFPAASAIDWTRLGPKIGERPGLGMKALADKTVERIRRGMGKFAGGPPIVIPAKAVWGSDRPVNWPLTTQTGQQDKALCTTGITLPVAGNTHERPGQIRSKSLSDTTFTQHTTLAFGFAHSPFMTEMRGGGSVLYGQHGVSDPLHTVTAGGNHHGIVSPAMFAKFNGGPEDTAWHHMGDTLNTITARDTTGLVVLPWVEQYQSDPVRITEQLATVMTHARLAYAAAPNGELDPVSDEDLLSVHFRMLDPDPELRRAMAFEEDYMLIGNKTEMTAGLGNAVTPVVATWITGQALATLGAEISQAA